MSDSNAITYEQAKLGLYHSRQELEFDEVNV